jgi:integrase
MGAGTNILLTSRITHGFSRITHGFLCPQWQPACTPRSRSPGDQREALAAGRYGDRGELMLNTAAYTGLRWGELTALAVPQVDLGPRVIGVDRKVIEVAGHLYLEAPKNHKRRQTVFPRATPAGYPLADKLTARIHAIATEQQAGINPLGLLFPSYRKVLATVQLQSPCPRARLSCRRMAKHPRQHHLDLAQPATRVLHNGPVHLAPGPHRRVPHGRSC